MAEETTRYGRGQRNGRYIALIRRPSSDLSCGPLLPWPVEPAVPALLPIRRGRDAGWGDVGGSRRATTWRPRSHGRGWLDTARLPGTRPASFVRSVAFGMAGACGGEAQCMRERKIGCCPRSAELDSILSACRMRVQPMAWRHDVLQHVCQ